MSTQKTPDLIKLYVKSCVIGFVLSAVFLGLLMWFDVVGIGRLIFGSDIGLMAAVVFWILNGIVFAGVQFGIAVMSLGRDDDDDGHGGGMMLPVFLAEPVPVRVSPKCDDPRR